MRTAIIGGGIGSLVTALYLQKQGDDVTIYEKKQKLGGRLAFVEEGEFKIDEGPTIILLPTMLREILEDIDISESELEMLPIDPMYPIHFKDGTTFTKWSNEKKQLEEIESLFPGEAENYKKYINDMSEHFLQGKAAFLEKSFENRRSFWTKTNMQTLLKLKAYQTVQKQARDYFKEKKLQEAFSLQTLYIGGSPEQTPAIYSLVSYSEHDHGIWYLKGGYARLVEILVSEIEKRGVQVELESDVKKIITKQQQATALILHGREIVYDRFIINGDLPVARSLVEEKPKRTFTPSSGGILIYLGLDGKLDTDHVHQFFMGEDLNELMEDIFGRKQLPQDPAFYVFHPSIIDPTLAPEGKSVAYVLIPVPSNTDISVGEYEAYSEVVLEKMEKLLDHKIKNKIIWKKVRTPHDSQRDGLFQGGCFGIAPTLFQSGVFRPQLKPFSYDNVYAVGASIHPGGGVPIVMQGAKLLAEHIKSIGNETKTV